MRCLVCFTDGTEHEVCGETMMDILPKISDLILVTGRTDDDIKSLTSRIGITLKNKRAGSFSILCDSEKVKEIKAEFGVIIE